MNYLPLDLWNYLEEPPVSVQGSYEPLVLHGYLHWAHWEGWSRIRMYNTQRENPEVWHWLPGHTVGQQITAIRAIDCYVIAVSYAAILYGWDLISVLQPDDPTYNLCFPIFSYAGMIAARMGRLELTKRIVTTFQITSHGQALILTSSLDGKVARLLKPQLRPAEGYQLMHMLLQRDDVGVFSVIKDLYPYVLSWSRYLEAMKCNPGSKILAYVKEHGM